MVWFYEPGVVIGNLRTVYDATKLRFCGTKGTIALRLRSDFLRGACVKRTIVLLSGLGVLAAAAPASDRAAVLKAVTDCRALTDGAARLSCYDGAVGTLDAAAARRDIVVLDREEVKQTRRGLFGFSLPRLPFFKGDESQKADMPSELLTTAQGVRPLGHGKWRIVVEGGAVWETTEPVLRHDPKVGGKIRIRQGSMTNYFLSVDGDPAVRAKRVG